MTRWMIARAAPAVAGDGGQLLKDGTVQFDLMRLGRLSSAEISLDHHTVAVKDPETMHGIDHVLRLDPMMPSRTFGREDSEIKRSSCPSMISERAQSVAQSRLGQNEMEPLVRPIQDLLALYRFSAPLH